jgi:micrococcal nuclease
MKERLLIFFLTAFLLLGVQNKFFNTSSQKSSAPSLAFANITKSPPETNATSTAIFISRVIDGDTVVANIDGVVEKIRLIGVDTPETVDPRKPVQCFGKEASAFTTSLLLNNRVRLEADTSQDNRDKYGRLLRYIFLADGTNVDEEIIAEGYGHEYTYRTPYKYQTEFKNAEKSARESQKGLWANGVCSSL